MQREYESETVDRILYCTEYHGDWIFAAGTARKQIGNTEFLGSSHDYRAREKVQQIGSASRATIRGE